MSLDIKHVTNGTTEIYRIIDSAAGTFNVYYSYDEIPKRIRHYVAPDSPKLIGPDTASLFGVRDILYPEVQKCGHPDFIDEKCIAESCNYAPDGDWTRCPYFHE